jgi:hypothetical protein
MTLGTRLEHAPRKSLTRLAQETGVSKSSPRRATQLLKPSSESRCAVSARRNVAPAFLNETINCEKYIIVERIAFSKPVVCELELLHSGMLIHQEYSYPPRSKRCTGRREAQSHEPGPHSTSIPSTFRCVCLPSTSSSYSLSYHFYCSLLISFFILYLL